MQCIFIGNSSRNIITSLRSYDFSALESCLTKQLKIISSQQKESESLPKNYCSSTIPAYIIQRYEQLNFIKNSQLLQPLLRPIIYLDLEIVGIQRLGRLVIELFTEACPVVVLQFVRTCLYKQYNCFNINRLLLPFWLKVELLFGNTNVLTSSNILEHDPMAINHGASCGILSFPSRYLRGSKFHFITFTMSFTPIDVLNGKRIAFGIVRRGQNVLTYLQSLNTSRCGKLCKKVVVSACGVLYC